jgi:hypothetical protein
MTRSPARTHHPWGRCLLRGEVLQWKRFYSPVRDAFTLCLVRALYDVQNDVVGWEELESSPEGEPPLVARVAPLKGA